MNLLQANPFWKAFFKQRKLVFYAVAVGCVLGYVNFKLVPRSYKVIAAFTLQTQYFQNPLVSSFMPATWDSNELKSQREALLYRALSFEFLRGIGTRYHLFGKKSGDEISTYELDEFKRSFEVLGSGPTSFQISYFSSDPELGYRILQDFLTHLRKLMADERRQSLINTHDAIRSQLEALSFGKQTGDLSPILANRPDLVQKRIEKISEEIRVLRTSFSDAHPRISELNRQLQQLSRWLAKPGDASAAPASTSPNPNNDGRDVSGIMAPRTEVFSGAKVDEAARDLFEDLLKMYHYLEVVIDLDSNNSTSYLTLLKEPFVPHSPIWPRLPIFLAWGVALGFLSGAGLALYRELIAAKREGKSSAEAGAEGQSGVPAHA